VYRGGDRSSAGNNGPRSRDGNGGMSGRPVAVAAGSGAGTSSGSGGGTSTGAGTGAAVGRREDGPRNTRGADGERSGAPPHARGRDGNEPVVGTAVPRGSVPPATGGGGTSVGTGHAFYPWWFGGAGYYGGYYGGYYDPWYGGYTGYDDPDPGFVSNTRFADEGSLRLKIKPRDAEVYVDGYFVGVVDDFDGVFQRLHIETGGHRVEIRAPGYETLFVDVRITPDHGTTYQGELKRVP
jgi:hypothetical protein